MQKFDGFPDGSKLSPTAFPAMFYTHLLPIIDDLAELKVTIFCLWALQQREGRFRYLRYADFCQDADLRRGLLAVQPDADPEITLKAALQRAIERGTLICAEVALDSGPETLYFVNTEKGRTAVAQVKAGEWQPGDDDHPVEILPERPNIYRLYERNIGPLTPRIADHLKDAEKEYPLEWILEAIHQAVDLNKRSWRYVQAILKRREREGKQGEFTKRSPGQDGKRYASGEFADFIEH